MNRFKLIKRQKCKYVAGEEESFFDDAPDKTNLAAGGYNKEDICGVPDIDAFWRLEA